MVDKILWFFGVILIPGILIWFWRNFRCKRACCDPDYIIKKKRPMTRVKKQTPIKKKEAIVIKEQ